MTRPIRTTSETIGSALLLIGAAVIFWLCLFLTGCTTLPTVPNAEELPSSLAQVAPVSHGGEIYIINPREPLPSLTIYPTDGTFDPATIHVNAAFFSEDGEYHWRGVTCTSLGEGIIVGKAVLYRPAVGTIGTVFALIRPDSITLWGEGLRGEGGPGEVSVAVGTNTVTHRLAGIARTPESITRNPVESCYDFDAEECTVYAKPCPGGDLVVDHVLPLVKRGEARR